MELGPAGHTLGTESFIMYFRFGIDQLTVESEKKFPLIFAELKRYSAAELFVVGHFDRAGAKKLNAALNLKRANSTLRRLEEAG